MLVWQCSFSHRQIPFGQRSGSRRWQFVPVHADLDVDAMPTRNRRELLPISHFEQSKPRGGWPVALPLMVTLYPEVQPLLGFIIGLQFHR